MRRFQTWSASRALNTAPVSTWAVLLPAKPSTTDAGTTTLPVSKVSFGFASAGTDFDGKNAANKDLFGGGSGAGVNIPPVAFLVVKDGCVRTIQLSDGNNTVDRALTMIPELEEKVSALN